jgi:SOS-response transcriptional repressor LexA
MTRGQKQVLDAIKDYFSEHSVPPTIRELMEMTGHKSTNSIRGYLQLLERDGAIAVEPLISRGIRLKEGYCPSCGRAW